MQLRNFLGNSALNRQVDRLRKELVARHNAARAAVAANNAALADESESETAPAAMGPPAPSRTSFNAATLCGCIGSSMK